MESSDTSFERSLGESTATRTLKLGSTLYPPYTYGCATGKPITCDLPGAAVDVLKLLASSLDAQFDLHNFPSHGFGYSTEGNATIMGALVGGAVQAAGPGLLYES